MDVNKLLNGFASDKKYNTKNDTISITRQREGCELKINELYEQLEKIYTDFEHGKCSFDYLKLNIVKINAEMRGIYFALGQDVEAEMGMEE